MSDEGGTVKCDEFDHSLTDTQISQDHDSSSLPDVPCGGESDENEETGDPISRKEFAGMDNELDFEVETEERNQQVKRENATEKNEKIEHGDDDGECTEDDDDDDDGSLEEGELKEKDDGTAKPIRQICRFYNRGQCFYGNVCRFLHLNNESKGNYNMFAPVPTRSYDANFAIDNIAPQNVGMMHRIGPRTGPDFMQIPPPPMPLPATADLPPIESAWEKGLREAKELVKQGKIRKKEPDFEEKRLNLGLVANEKRDYDKENDINMKTYKKKKRQPDSTLFNYEEPEFYEPADPRIQHCNRYENFEMKFYNNERNDRGRERRSTPTDRKDKSHRPRKERDRLRDERMKQIPARKAEEFFDPWRRSKSPKHNQRRTRSRSFGSFSSVSSYSYSTRSSCSYSRSSSRSSGRSSRSHSPHQKRKMPPTQAISSPKSLINKFAEAKKKSGLRGSSSRSITRSRSRSRSISMDSVSSASSSPLSRSSSPDSVTRRNSQMPIVKKPEEKPILGEKVDPKVSTSGLFQEVHRPLKIDKIKEAPPISVHEDEIDPLEEKFHMPPPMRPDELFPSLPPILPVIDRIKEPLKGPHKQPIKLTLLNKNPQSKLMNIPKKEFDVNKAKPTDEPPRVATFPPIIKRPSSPPVQGVIAKPAVVQKKSASSRRDELLKQLKAVEDAIARKRAKFC